MNTEQKKNSYSCDSPGHDNHGVQPFDGFPYFVTRIVPALYDVILLPTEMNEASLIAYSEHQACSNKLDACLVLSENRGLWFTPEGGKSFSSHTPWGGILMTGGLKTCREFYTFRRTGGKSKSP